MCVCVCVCVFPSLPPPSLPSPLHCFRRDGAVVVRAASAADAAALAAAGLPSVSAATAGRVVHVRFSTLTRKGVSQAAEAKSFRDGLLFGPGVIRSKQMVGLLDAPTVRKASNKARKQSKRT